MGRRKRSRKKSPGARRRAKREKYQRMLRGMRERAGSPRDWAVYMLRCGDGSLYTGIAKDVEARLRAHSAGRGAAYTRTHLPVELVYSEEGYSRSEALVREARIKSMPRPKKQSLVGTPRVSCPPTAKRV